jgi:hypothetical protein
LSIKNKTIAAIFSAQKKIKSQSDRESRHAFRKYSCLLYRADICAALVHFWPRADAIPKRLAPIAGAAMLMKKTLHRKRMQGCATPSSLGRILQRPIKLMAMSVIEPEQIWGDV